MATSRTVCTVLVLLLCCVTKLRGGVLRFVGQRPLFRFPRDRYAGFLGEREKTIDLQHGFSKVTRSRFFLPLGCSAPVRSRSRPTWAELDAQFYAEQRAAESAAMLPAANSSAAGAASSSVGQSTLPPPSWVELAYRRFYAERAARSPAEPGGAPPMGQPPTWAELYALRAAGLAANEQGAVQGGSAASSAAEQEPDVAAARALTDLGQRRGAR